MHVLTGASLRALRVWRGTPPLGEMLLGVILPRAAFILTNFWVFGYTLEAYTYSHDGRDYLAFAEAIRNLRFENLTPFQIHIFPGYPLLLALSSVLVDSRIASLVLGIGGAFFAVFFFSRTFNDRWATRYFYFFTPAWLLFSSLNMSEGAFMGLQGVSLFLFLRNRYLSSLLILSYATLIRPTGVLLAVPLLILLWRRSLIQATIGTALYASLPLAWAGFNVLLWQDVLAPPKAASEFSYSGQLFAFPFTSLIANTLDPSNAPYWKAYVWANALLLLFSSFMAWRHHVSRRSELSLLMLLWLLSSSTFYFSVGGHWGFGALDRFLITALPAMAWAMSPLLPRNRLFLGLLVMFSFLVAFRGTEHPTQWLPSLMERWPS